MGWGYWPSDFRQIPAVDTWKFIEHRHITQICNRWNTNHTVDLQQAFFNGDGFVSWESVWGTWNGLSLFDGEATRRVGALLRFLTSFFHAGPDATSTTWEPHTAVTEAAYAAGIFASRWELPAGGDSPYSDNATAYTIVSKGAADWAGPTLPVPCDGGGALFFDLYTGLAAPVAPVPVPGGSGCALPLAIEVNGYGAVLALSAANGAPTPAALSIFLSKMAEMTARPLTSYDTTPTYLQQTMTFIAPAPLANAPADTVFVSGQSAWPFSVEGTLIEGRTVKGNDVQYPWEPLAITIHAPHPVDIPNLFVDVTPVTNAAFGAFLAATNYTPTDDHNFLRDWDGARSPPSGWENKPVTWVDLLDARAFCASVGKRLPHDWEWQYVAQGGDSGKIYPWGNAWDNGMHVPPQQNGTVRPPPPNVGSIPAGDTPNGLKDMMGLVWQWTDEFTDDHTRAGLVRGGSYYTAAGSLWYFPNHLDGNDPHGITGASLRSHNKLLLMSPAYDRHGAVGFRCVADAPGFPPPPPPPPPVGCASGACAAFCLNAAVQGCAATLPGNVSLRASPTGKPCGGALGPCAAAADACAAGWLPCLSDFSKSSLSADGFRANMSQIECVTGGPGRFVAAMSHADCTKCPNAPSSADMGCKATGCGAEAICCGTECVLAGCDSDVWEKATYIYDDQTHGCGNAAASVADGVLCCKV